MIVSIMQPAYLPWLGYFERVAQSDMHIVLDHVQIDKNSKTKFTNRNKVRTKEGWTWLTVPLKTKGRFGSLFIDQLEIDNESRWSDKHCQTLRLCYGKTPYFKDYAPALESILRQERPLLNDLMRNLTTYLMRDVLRIETPLSYSSEMAVEGHKDDLILSLCKAVGATTYISGPFGRDYLNEAAFRESGIDLVFHDYVHPTYTQAFPGFEPYMSIVDLLFNHGPESLALLSTAQKTEASL